MCVSRCVCVCRLWRSQGIGIQVMPGSAIAMDVRDETGAGILSHILLPVVFPAQSVPAGKLSFAPTTYLMVGSILRGGINIFQLLPKCPFAKPQNNT